MRSMKIWIGVAAALVVAPVAGAVAQRVETFYVINETDQLIIAVQGDSGSGWSDNWLPDNRPVSPGGDGILIRFEKPSNRCEMNIRVTFEDESTRDDTHSFCGITTLFVGAQDQWTE